MDNNQITVISRKDISVVYLEENQNKVRQTITEMCSKQQVNKLTMLFELPIKLEKQYEKQVIELNQLIDSNQLNGELLKDAMFVLDHKCKKMTRYCLPDTSVRLNPVYTKDDKRKFKLSNYDTLFSRYSGNESNFFNHQFLEYNSSYIPAFGTEFRVTPTYTEAGFGRGKTDASARTLSCIEAFERYINMYNHTNVRTVRSSFSELKHDRVLDPKSLILHSKTQYQNKNYKLKQYSDDLPIDWVEGRHLNTGSKILVPKNAIWFGEKKNNETSNIYSFETSNGMAIGGTKEEATLYGAYELIERDCFLRAWYGKTVVPEVNWKSNGLDDFEALSELLEKRKQYIHVFDITGGTGIPTYWVMLKSENENSSMAIYNAAGCNLDPIKAIESALFEVLTSFPIYEKILTKNNMLRERAKYVQTAPQNVTEFQDHVLYYANHKNSNYFKYLLGQELVELNNNDNIPNTLSEELNVVKELLEKEKYQLICVDITPPFLRNENLIGIKTIVPGLLPMTFGEQYRRISRSKVEKFNARYKQSLEKINFLPHPFP